MAISTSSSSTDQSITLKTGWPTLSTKEFGDLYRIPPNLAGSTIAKYLELEGYAAINRLGSMPDFSGEVGAQNTAYFKQSIYAYTRALLDYLWDSPLEKKNDMQSQSMHHFLAEADRYFRLLAGLPASQGCSLSTYEI